MRISIEFYPDNLINLFKGFNNNFNKLLLKPKFISITNHKFKDKSLIKEIKNYYKNICPHLCFFNKNINNLIELINYYYILNLKNLVILKGDNNNNFFYSYNLNKFLKFNFKNYFIIINGIYMESHPNSFSFFSDIKNNILKNIDSDYYITQYFYNIDSYIFYAIYLEFYKNKIIPAFIITNSIYNLIKFSNKCKCNLPFWFIRQLNNKNFKIRYINFIDKNFNLNYIIKLLNNDIKKFHFYTLNDFFSSNDLIEILINVINV